MKKLLVTVAAILSIALLTGCPGAPKDNDGSDDNSGSATNSESSSNSGTGNGSDSDSDSGSDSGTTTPARTKASNKFGEWEGAYEVGDIVFTDGSATPYSNTLSLSDEQKAAAIAIIFYKGTGLNTDVNYEEDTSKTRTLGIGLLHSEDVPRIPWCLKDDDNDIVALGYYCEFETTECTWSMPGGVRKFFGDKNGSDNLAQMSQIFKTKQTNGEQLYGYAAVDDTNNPDLYPAFYFAKNYKDQTGSRVKDTAYETGWFLPSLAEIWKLCEVKDTVDAASELCGGSKFVLSGHDSEPYYERPYYYWTSTDTKVYRDTDCYYASIFSFYAEGEDTQDKSMDCWVLAIREF